MGRDHSFMDKEFGRIEYSPEKPATCEKDLVFVIMPFSGSGMNEVYSAIKDECEKLNLRATRVDENVGSSFIIKDIVDLIKRAEFIICDLSKERPNVYYELGFAHGVGNEAEDILLIAKKGTKLHFDIAPLRVQLYKSTENLRIIIKSNLEKMIEITRKMRGRSNFPTF